jgi:hypothetical protein
VQAKLDAAQQLALRVDPRTWVIAFVGTAACMAAADARQA